MQEVTGLAVWGAKFTYLALYKPVIRNGFMIQTNSVKLCYLNYFIAGLDFMPDKVV